MNKSHLGKSFCVLSLIICLGLNCSCRKTKDQSEPETVGGPTRSPVDLGRDDMVALPGAEVDTQLLEQFPHFLRQQSSMEADEVFAIYDAFFSDKGWSVESSLDPLSQNPVHRYRLGSELAFVTVTEVGQGLNEVTLSRREIRDDEVATTNPD